MLGDCWACMVIGLAATSCWHIDVKWGSSHSSGSESSRGAPAVAAVAIATPAVAAVAVPVQTPPPCHPHPRARRSAAAAASTLQGSHAHAAATDATQNTKTAGTRTHRLVGPQVPSISWPTKPGWTKTGHATHIKSTVVR